MTQTQYTARFCTEETVIADSEEEAKRKVSKAFGHSPATVELLDSQPIDAIDGPAASITFHPQRWNDDYAHDADPKGRTTWRVPLEDVITDEGQLVEDNSHESDALRYHERAPVWVKNWSGPFYVTIDTVENIPDEYDTLESALDALND